MQAVMLAAGMGKRLAKFTKDNTKCMVEVAGKKLIDHAIDALLKVGIKRFVIVTGYQGENLKKYVTEKYSNVLEIVFVENKDYALTNNIYSFYLAKSELLKDDTILLESDLIYDYKIIKGVLDYPCDNVAAVAKYKSWMDGTCVTVDENDEIRSFVGKEGLDFLNPDKYFKTVNIYKFSKGFMENVYFPFLEAYMKAFGLNSYYETTLKIICKLPVKMIKAYEIGSLPWYEIDDEQDLIIANIIFSKGLNRYNDLMKQYGGFWRYYGFVDFCYLVNPYFPKQIMVDKLMKEYPVLLTQYPSGLAVQNMNASRMFNINKEYILVGNGAAELINAFGHISKGSVGVNTPTFNEYVRCFKNSKVNKIHNELNDYSLSVKSIKESIEQNDTTIVVNPENPSGFLLSKKEIEDLAEYSKSKQKRLVIDESFIDFADKKDRYTLVENSFLEKYPNVVVIKSISKSYGIPGLRLGILVSSDAKLLASLKENMQVWNINSFAEYFLQIYNIFNKDYWESCDKIAAERERVDKELRKLPWLKVYSSSANFIMIDLGKVSSTELASRALDEHNLIIKDLATKDGFEGKNFIRIAVRNKHDNDIFLNFIKNYK